MSSYVFPRKHAKSDYMEAIFKTHIENKKGDEKNMTKIRITKVTDGWWSKGKIGEIYKVLEEIPFYEDDSLPYISEAYKVYTEAGPKFVLKDDCEIVSAAEAETGKIDVIKNSPVKVGDYVRINKCEECSESEGKYGTVIRTGTAAEADFDVDIPSKVYGDYTWIDADYDEWSVFPKTDSDPDAVSHPSHYTAGEIEVIDIIAQTVSGYDDPFVAHCVGTATKYLNRAPYKHDTPTEDLKKAKAYLEFAINHLDQD
ncbi:DUF3310 domain-containing protein [Oceanobacillus neutriphilus]|uniref:DUF3310 domain-containing protein n=1 Tax=Oceanobacillus neutriphilus TaxID=531815 RepID=A0ABQ2NYB0_9BACI|nr:DUF3310 domain-containing protein [Oceanobacillus neutriphilus]GGP13524.1 hypothetical protein GCM10011346_33860 [Oceanobacillus neutriphilus]